MSITRARKKAMISHGWMLQAATIQHELACSGGRSLVSTDDAMSNFFATDGPNRE
jgi:hypothetical protein